MILAELTGTWSGTNAFRLMPSDPTAELPATATVTTAAGGHLTLVAYTWEHPDDGAQDGLLLIGTADEGDALMATWGDSWHQKPEPVTLSGIRAADGSVVLEYTYAGDWGWRILLAAGDAELRLRMENVIPAGHASAQMPAGPYPAMVMRARRP